MYLIDYYMPVLARLSEIMADPERLEDYDYTTLREELTAGIDDARSGCREAINDALCRDATFALVAFVDEKVLSSNWSRRHEWAAQLLQKQYFSTTNAGVLFFERLDQLNPFNPLERDVKEVYFYCLCLGFTGQHYRSGDQARLNAIIQGCREELIESRDGAVLFPEAYPTEVPADYEPPRRAANWKPLYIGLPAVLLLGLYIFFRNDIVSITQQFLLMV